MKKLSSVIYGKHRKFKILKHHASSKKQLFLLFAVSAKMKMKNYLKNKNQLRY